MTMHKQTIGSPPCEIRSFDSPADLVKAVVQDWVEYLQVMSMAGREPNVALSGGRIARTFLEEAARVLVGQPELAARVHYFWADERCVPPAHPESNYGLAATAYLRPLNVPEMNIHRIPGEFEPALAASMAIRGLLKWTGTDSCDVPALDLVMLGMGEDGHIASLFPGEPDKIMESLDCYRSVTATKPPPQRITISYGILAQAVNVWVLASGAGKEEALKTALTTQDSPLGRVLRSRPSTCIYTDLRPESGLARTTGPG